MRCTKRQLLAYLLIHPDFSGLKIKEASKLMDISKSSIYGLLTRFQKNCPKAFYLTNIKHTVYLCDPIEMNNIEHWQKIVEKF